MEPHPDLVLKRYSSCFQRLWGKEEPRPGSRNTGSLFTYVPDDNKIIIISMLSAIIYRLCSDKACGIKDSTD